MIEKYSLFMPVSCLKDCVLFQVDLANESRLAILHLEYLVARRRVEA